MSYESFGTYLESAGSRETVTAGGTDTYTATINPPIAAYAATQSFIIKFTNANTGAATINLNGLGAKALTKNGSVALQVGDIVAGQVYMVAYDGTRFQILGTVISTTDINRGKEMKFGYPIDNVQSNDAAFTAHARFGFDGTGS